MPFWLFETISAIPAELNKMEMNRKEKKEKFWNSEIARNVYKKNYKQQRLDASDENIPRMFFEPKKERKKKFFSFFVYFFFLLLFK